MSTPLPSSATEQDGMAPLPEGRRGSSEARAGLAGPNYRPDVDGLRAVAVLAVVAYHAFPGSVRGGFIGVDVFFVISGYLISSIIFRGLDRGKFTFAGFYGRRIRRIFPALAVVLASVFLIAWFTLLSDELARLAKHIAAGAGFVSNLALWGESGYFDAVADTKPLLHLWSLGIEEQFYILWPISAWLLWRERARAHALAIMLVAAGFSFAWSVRLCATDRVASFYAPYSRFWELALGAALAYLSSYRSEPEHPGQAGWAAGLARLVVPTGARRKSVQAALGIALLAIGFVAVTPERPFPGTWALLPTAGTLLLIGAGPEAWLNRFVLSLKPMVWIGLISYPLYLWHWPLLTVSRVVAGGLPVLRWRVLVVILSILLAWATYLLLERPIRRRPPGMGVALPLVSAMCLIGVVGLTAWSYGGLSFRSVNMINAVLDSGYDGADGGYGVAGCGVPHFDDPNVVCLHDVRQPVRFAVIGDSKARSLYPGLLRTSLDCGRWLVFAGKVVPVISDREIYRPFQSMSAIAVKAIAENPQIEKVAIVTATRQLFQLNNTWSIADLPESKHYPAALEGLGNTLRVLTSAGKRVILVVDNPTLPDPKDCIARRTGSELLNRFISPEMNPACSVPLARHLELSRQYRSLLSELAAPFQGAVQVFDTIPYLCESGTCSPLKDGRLLYAYSDHISEYASALIGRDLNRLACGE